MTPPLFSCAVSISMSDIHKCLNLFRGPLNTFRCIAYNNPTNSTSSEQKHTEAAVRTWKLGDANSSTLHTQIQVVFYSAQENSSQNAKPSIACSVFRMCSVYRIRYAIWRAWGPSAGYLPYGGAASGHPPVSVPVRMKTESNQIDRSRTVNSHTQHKVVFDLTDKYRALLIAGTVFVSHKALFACAARHAQSARRNQLPRQWRIATRPMNCHWLSIQ